MERNGGTTLLFSNPYHEQSKHRCEGDMLSSASEGFIICQAQLICILIFSMLALSPDDSMITWMTCWINRGVRKGWNSIIMASLHARTWRFRCVACGVRRVSTSEADDCYLQRQQGQFLFVLLQKELYFSWTTETAAHLRTVPKINLNQNRKKMRNTKCWEGGDPATNSLRQSQNLNEHLHCLSRWKSTPRWQWTQKRCRCASFSFRLRWVSEV